MWKETKVVKDVRYFYSFDARYGVYATTDKNDQSILFIADKEIPIREAGDIKSYDDKVVVQVDDGKGRYDTMLFTKEGELLNVVNDTISLDDNTNLRYLNKCERIGLTRHFNLVDIETGKVIFKENIQERKLFVFNDMIFSNRDNVIIRHGWDGSIMWQHNYEPDFNVAIDLGFVLEGVCGGKLWVKSKVDWHEILLAIDVSTGELIKAFSDSKEDTNLPHCNLGGIADVYLNCESDKILVVAGDKEYYMIILDAKTLEVVEKDEYSINYDYAEGEESLIRISEFLGDYITVKIMALKRDSGNFTGFAVYNYKTKEVVLAQRVITPEQAQDGLEISVLSPLHYSPDSSRILVHDRWNNLHIFEDVKE